MKKKVLIVSSLSLLALSCGAVLVFSGKKTEKADAYSASSLPTTIDLNDSTASEIRSYYSSLNSLSASERQGNNLLKNLKTILKNGQNYFKYDSNNGIWQMYEITDRDWDKSPASSTTYGTYNSGTNTITNYVYGSNEDGKNNPYIHALYINRNVENQTQAWGNHNQDQWGINREHVWPKAEGFDSTGAGGARGDPMHLMAGNGYSNNIHSNYFYGYVDTSTTYTNCGTKYSNQNGNFLGSSKTVGGSTNVFEPQDCDKGDIARAIFYMVARYNYLSGSDSDGIDSNNPNLALTQSLSDWSSTGYSSTTSTKGYMGIVSDLLAWNRLDPPDAYEIHRNNLLYKNFTNNRNPFIDYPEWAEFIWGKPTYTNNWRTYSSYSTTPTGYAKPSSDSLNDFSNGGSVDPDPVTSITATANKTFTVGETITKSDITVKDNNDTVITDFTFSNYVFTYADAASGGALTNKTFTNAVSYSTFQCSVTAQVQREEYVEPVSIISDNLDKTWTGVTGTSYTSWTEKDGSSGLTTYAGTSAGGNSSIQLRTKSGNEGIVTTSYVGTSYLCNVSVTWNTSTANGRAINIYGKETAYSSSEDLYSGSSSTQGTLLGTITYGTSTELSISGNYKYIGIRAASDPLYLSEIVISYGAGVSTETPANVANFIMYTDTTNQCLTKLDDAIDMFEAMSSANRGVFMNSSDYVISTARERFEAWLANQGKSINYVNGDYEISSSFHFNAVARNDSNLLISIVIITSVICATSLLGFMIIRRKRSRR